MAKSHRYRLNLSWIGAQQGPNRDYASYSRTYRVTIPGKPAFEGSSDPLFRGDPKLLNPEDLLVAALSSCHMLSYLALAARAGIAVLSYEDEAEGTVVLEGGGGRFTEVVLHPRVTLASGSDRAKAEALQEEAHEICFIANSVNFPVRHEAVVSLAAAAE